MLNQPLKPSNKVVSLHAIMSNIKKQNKQKPRSMSYHSNQIKSEGQSILLRDDDQKKLNDQIRQKDELINQLQSQQQSFRKQLNEIFEVNHGNDESLILHIYSSVIQFKKDRTQHLQQQEINNKVILHYKGLLQQSTDLIANQEEQLQNHQQLLITLTNQIKENSILQHLNTSNQEKQQISKFESMQSQNDKFRNASLITTFRKEDSYQYSKLQNACKLLSSNPEEIEDEILQFVRDTLQFYQAIGNQQIYSFIKSQFENERVQLTFNLNQINNEVIKVLINKFDLDDDIEQEMEQLILLKQIKSHNNQILQQIDQLGEYIIVKLQNYKRNEISRIMLIHNLVNLKKQIIKKH
ncbi:unnamed protein product (macronuclear) [Paramecium tetraurelia]|uniref:Uncharacterized protein n=1 Tax=Paramecium tetraurelia TaxID=5888 RepID=A0DME0_PARTE|nr:uncharacterized protein GSPATT00018425001 [Paramecium tetraurelia]CAK84207.1 unnamed protein product [Paramecium tetraurelia]|eukprot:XP_001451604.1 hypothetical protein (macronuclear) [Paramecium tetraurelia strain d4-2]